MPIAEEEKTVQMALALALVGIKALTKGQMAEDKSGRREGNLAT